MLSYEEFRTGLTFYDVRWLLHSWSDDKKDWRHVTRHTVLGKWREIKKRMYAEYVKQYKESLEEIPF